MKGGVADPAGSEGRDAVFAAGSVTPLLLLLPMNPEAAAPQGQL